MMGLTNPLSSTARFCAVLVGLLLFLLSVSPAFAADMPVLMDLTHRPPGHLALLIFIAAAALVVLEHKIGLCKSRPALLAAGLIWIIVAVACGQNGRAAEVAPALAGVLGDFAAFFLFMLAAMSYINAIEERNVFAALRGRLVTARLSLRAIFWLTGVIAFLLSPLAGNLATALAMGAVVMAAGAGNQKFTGLSCLNVVVAANAGGVFSPFGDASTYLVWQEGLVSFSRFFVLVAPAFIGWFLPACIFSLAVPRARPEVAGGDSLRVKPGGLVVAALLPLTALLTVVLYEYLRLPPYIGMMTGLAALKITGYVIFRHEDTLPEPAPANPLFSTPAGVGQGAAAFKNMKRTEWSALMFFYGAFFTIAGLAALGYLKALSDILYGGSLGVSGANILIGLVSSIFDSAPLMYAALGMAPDMAAGQWLLLTLTAGLGGSILSVGSAAGIALLLQSKGGYTFGFHLKWCWAVFLGYIAAVALHMTVNAGLFS